MLAQASTQDWPDFEPCTFDAVDFAPMTWGGLIQAFRASETLRLIAVEAAGPAAALPYLA